MELDKTQVAAEAAIGLGPVKVLREMKICKKHKILHQYCLFLFSNNVDLKNNNRECRKPCWMLWVCEQLQYICFNCDEKLAPPPLPQWQFYGGGLGGPQPPEFCLDPVCPPSFFLISRLSSFGWHMQSCQMRCVKIPAILPTAPDLSSVVIRKQHRENRDNQYC